MMTLWDRKLPSLKRLLSRTSKRVAIWENSRIYIFLLRKIGNFEKFGTWGDFFAWEKLRRGWKRSRIRLAYEKSSAVFCYFRDFLKQAETPKFENDGTDMNYLEYIFGFIERDPPLNPTSAGYFQKLLNSLINKRGFDVIL